MNLEIFLKVGKGVREEGRESSSSEKNPLCLVLRGHQVTTPERHNSGKLTVFQPLDFPLRYSFLFVSVYAVLDEGWGRNVTEG